MTPPGLDEKRSGDRSDFCTFHHQSVRCGGNSREGLAQLVCCSTGSDPELIIQAMGLSHGDLYTYSLRQY